MKKFFLSATLLLTLLGSASADTIFYNATKEKIKVNVTLPSGKVESREIDKGSSIASHTSFIFDYRITNVEYEIQDDFGTTIGKGTADAKNGSYAVVATGDGNKVFPVGFYSGNGDFRAASVANLTGESGTFDFIGDDGLDGQRGVSLPSSFDPQKMFKFADGERKYSVKFTSSNGQVHDIEQKIEPGRYYAVYHGPNGKVVISYFGYIKS